jgi:hypothetical protein
MCCTTSVVVTVHLSRWRRPGWARLPARPRAAALDASLSPGDVDGTDDSRVAESSEDVVLSLRAARLAL